MPIVVSCFQSSADVPGSLLFSGGDQGWGWGDSGELDQGEKRCGDLGGEEGGKTAIWMYCMKEE